MPEQMIVETTPFGCVREIVFDKHILKRYILMNVAYPCIAFTPRECTRL
jgi:hypothetical protein